MDSRFPNSGFNANDSANRFKIFSSPMQVGGTADTVLRLDSPGSTIPYMSSKGIKRKRSLMDPVGSSLSLGLGHSSSSSDSKGSSTTQMSSAKETDEESSVMDIDLTFSLNLGTEKVMNLKKGLVVRPKVDLELCLSTGPTESDLTSVYLSSSPPSAACGVQNADEGSTSICWKNAVNLPPLQISPTNEGGVSLKEVPRTKDRTTAVPDRSTSMVTIPNSSVTCTSGITRKQQPQAQQRNSSSKICQIEGCGKGARGASGRCISHGGGRRCQKQGCQKGAEGRTAYCKAHGGGRRCEFLGCTKSAEGRTDYCIGHGGGRRCSHDGCTRAARGKSGLCIRHGGGKRCQYENCTKSAEGLSGLCISHGGGKRCQFIGCTKGAQGSTMLCKAHGGGKRCTHPGCSKGAEGSTPFCKGHGGGKRCAFQGGGVCSKSVHGGTNFCVAHGGGKRCAYPECTKSARGRTNFCVRHGGGKRCKSDGCNKSAQGSTDFCKAHGGGKRCSWGHPGSEHGNQSTGPCNSFARSKTGLCALHSGLVQDRRVHGGITLGPIVHVPKLNKPEKMKEVVTTDNMNVDVTNIEASATLPGWLQTGGANANVGVREPEGRVHGGSLLAMAMLTGCSLTSSSVPRNWI